MSSRWVNAQNVTWDNLSHALVAKALYSLSMMSENHDLDKA